MAVYIYSREQIEKDIRNGTLNNVAIVSFSDTEEEFIEFPFTENVLRVAFYDVRPFTVAKHHYAGILPQAKEIAEFIYKAVNEGKDIVCQCDYGVSRSAGCAAAILEMLYGRGIDIFADYRYTPNQFVYNKVLNELRKTKERNKK